MSQRPKGTEGATGASFDALPPANAGEVKYDETVPPAAERVVLGPQPTPGQAQAVQLGAGGGGPLASPGAYVAPGTDGSAVVLGSGLAEAAAGNPHLAGVRPGAPKGGTFGMPPELMTDLQAAEDVSDEALLPEAFLWNVQSLNIYVTEGRPPSPKDGMVGIDPDYMKVQNFASRTPSLESLLPKFWRFCQSCGMRGEVLKKEARLMAAAVILKMKDMCAHPDRYNISYRCQPEPIAVDPDESLRQQVAVRAKEKGVSPADFIARLVASGAQGARGVNPSGGEPTIIQTATQFDKARQLLDQVGVHALAAEVEKMTAQQGKPFQLGRNP